MMMRRFHCRFLLFVASATLLIAGCGDDEDSQPPEEPPEVEILAGPASLIGETDARFEFECLDERNCEFVCRLDDEDAESCSSPVEYEGLDDGDHVFEVTATDDYDLESEPVQWTWTVDTVDPIIEIFDAPPTETTDDAAAFEFGCANKPSCSFECSVDYDDGSGSPQTGSWDSCSSPHIVDELDPGEYTLHIRATDEAGNQGVESLDWKVLEVLEVEWKAISAGSEHTCGVRDEGTLWCWGLGWSGQLGVGELMSSRDAPDQVGDDTDWRSVFAGGRHTCGVREDGTLWCWGSNSHGQLGLGDESVRTIPEQVGDDSDWKSVSAGWDYTCGVRGDGTLWCWGWNEDGQLGLGDEEDRDRPEQVGEDTDWQSVSAGLDHVCGVRDDGALWCWGAGGDGQLGLGDAEGRDRPEQVGEDTDWQRVSAGSGLGRGVGVDVGGNHTCGVRDEGTLWCWGSNGYGELGLGDTLDRDRPEQVAEHTDWQSISSGGDHTCGVQEDGTLWCWGRGLSGRLGLGDQSDRDRPEQVGEDTDWEYVSAAGRGFTCGARDGGILWCWGVNRDGNLGLGAHAGAKATPQSIDFAEAFTTISAGNHHGCGVGADATLWCWGWNGYGELGLADELHRDRPDQVGDDTDWQSVSVGSDHVCGVRDDGTLWCWGRGDFGKLGLGDEEERDRPEQVGDDADWESVSSGRKHTCGVRDDGTLWCWGSNGYGELGLGDEEDRDRPEQVGEDTDWESVSSGSSYTCAVRDDATLWCWGNSPGGQLGLGDESVRDRPEQVGEDTNWESVSSGSFHICGVRDDGTLWCWGRNTDGQLGVGDESARDTPVQVGQDTDWENVTAGGGAESHHSCGVRDDGTLWCWGTGLSGQLGLGDKEDRDRPEQVGEDTDWESVSAGGMHTLAIRTSGAGWSWGYNSDGRLGDGMVWKSEPHEVPDP